MSADPSPKILLHPHDIIKFNILIFISYQDSQTANHHFHHFPFHANHTPLDPSSELVKNRRSNLSVVMASIFFFLFHQPSHHISSYFHQSLYWSVFGQYCRIICQTDAVHLPIKIPLWIQFSKSQRGRKHPSASILFSWNRKLLLNNVFYAYIHSSLLQTIIVLYLT